MRRIISHVQALRSKTAVMNYIIATFLVAPISAQITLTTAQIAKKVLPAVVVIQGKTSSGEIHGSGFIVSTDGKIVTNLHVIRDMKTASIQLANGDAFDSVSVLATEQPSRFVAGSP